MSVSAGLGSSKHQISPITENSEPESCSSHESQMECNKSSLMFKMSEETNAANITTDDSKSYHPIQIGNNTFGVLNFKDSPDYEQASDSNSDKI